MGTYLRGSFRPIWKFMYRIVRTLNAEMPCKMTKNKIANVKSNKARCSSREEPLGPLLPLAPVYTDSQTFRSRGWNISSAAR